MSDTKTTPLQINWSHILTSLVLGAILGAFALVRVSDAQTIVVAGQSEFRTIN